jgi:calcium permeable stress-gated cation channel
MILMIAFMIFTVLYHLSLNSALDPLLKYLPKSLEADERALLEAENGVDQNGQGEKTATESKELPPAPHQKPNFLTKFLKPHIYQDYATMRRMVPRDFVNIEYEPEVERDAYLQPSIRSEPMLLWIPRDGCGVSRQEIRDTRRIIPITDEGAFFDEKNKIIWDQEEGVAPIHEEKTYY